MLGPTARETLASQVELAYAESQTDALPAARQRLDAAVVMLQQRFGDADPDTLSAQVDQARLTLQAGDYPAAERQARAAAAANRAAFGPRERRTLGARQVLAMALIAVSKRAEAEPILREILALRLEQQGPDAPAVEEAQSELANLLHDMALYDGQSAKWEEAGRCYEQCAEYAARVHGTSSSRYATALNNHASFLQDRARETAAADVLQRAITLFRESLALRETLDGPDSTRAAKAAGNLGGALCDAQDYAAALPQLQRALRINERVQGRLHPEVLRSLYNLMLTQSVAQGAASVQELVADMTQRLQECTTIDRKLQLTFSHGLLQMHFGAERFREILERGPSLHAECLQEWPGDGGPIGQKIALVLANAAMKLGDAEAEALWRPRSQPAR
jgi:tetratricopeptide (TPR) repeat protein